MLFRKELFQCYFEKHTNIWNEFTNQTWFPCESQANTQNWKVWDVRALSVPRARCFCPLFRFEHGVKMAAKMAPQIWNLLDSLLDIWKIPKIIFWHREKCSKQQSQNQEVRIFMRATPTIFAFLNCYNNKVPGIKFCGLELRLETLGVLFFSPFSRSFAVIPLYFSF